MAKRYLDTDIWKKQWFRELPLKLKNVWIYLITNCNHAGIYEVDTGLMSFMLGIEITEEEILTHLDDQIEVLNNGSKWFIKKFIKYQYGELKETNNVHRSVISILSHYKIDTYNSGSGQTLSRVKAGSKQGLKRPSPEAKDKDKDKDIDKAKDKAIVEVVEEFYDFMFLKNKDYYNGGNSGDYLTKGYDIVDKLIRIDGFRLETIKDALKWGVKDDFWKTQILSLGGLRKKSDNGEIKFRILYAKYKVSNKTHNVEDFVNG